MKMSPTWIKGEYDLFACEVFLKVFYVMQHFIITNSLGNVSQSMKMSRTSLIGEFNGFPLWIYILALRASSRNVILNVSKVLLHD